MLLTSFILHFALTYAGTCSARHRQGGSSGTKGAVQQQGGQPDGAPVVAPAPNAVSSSPAQSSSVAPVLGGSGSASDQTGGQTTGQTGGQTSGQQNVTQSGQQTGSGSTGQTGQGASKSAAQQVGSGSNNLIQVDGGVASSSIAPASAPSSSTAPAPAASSSSSASGGSTGGGATSSASTSGGMTASFTQYGAGDTFGSGNCNTATAACGWYSNPGYNAAVSQALFGVGPGGGAGPACGQCYRLSPVGEGTNSIVVKVNNLCPASGNPLCAAAADVDVNFDLCKDDGAAKALFGSSPTGQVNGTYAPVACSEWSGSGNLT